MKVIFVYNANSGLVNTLLDIGHKVISPDTYNCNLCQMTYGLINERKEWKEFRESSKHEMEFLHKDEFESKYNMKREYPIILKVNESNKMEEIIGTNELNKMKSVEELIKRLKEI